MRHWEASGRRVNGAGWICPALTRKITVQAGERDTVAEAAGERGRARGADGSVVTARDVGEACETSAGCTDPNSATRAGCTVSERQQARLSAWMRRKQCFGSQAALVRARHALKATTGRYRWSRRRTRPVVWPPRCDSVRGARAAPVGKVSRADFSHAAKTGFTSSSSRGIRPNAGTSTARDCAELVDPSPDRRNRFGRRRRHR